MVDRGAYEQSTLDLDRLTRYARRVAAETKLAPAAPITYQRANEIVAKHARSKRTWYGAPKRVEIESRETVSRTIEVAGPHWIISHRSWHHTESNRFRDGATLQQETHAQHYLLLLRDGALRSAWVQEDSAYQWGGRVRAGTLSTETTHHCDAPTESDLCKLDFERYRREWKQRENGAEHHYWMDRDPGRKLLRHAKGVGVNLALKDILEGRPPRNS